MAIFKRKKNSVNAAAEVVGKQDFNYKDEKGNDTFVVDFRGLSSATKPETWQGKQVGNGSTFVETDTGVAYLFDNTNWNPLS